MQNQTKRKGKELTVTLFIGGQQVDKLTAEQSSRVAERLSQVMSRYYTLHLSEFEKI